jgi:hypothetical protein
MAGFSQIALYSSASMPNSCAAPISRPASPADRLASKAAAYSNGEIAAAGAIYPRVLARDPEFMDRMIEAGRDREVRAA